MESILKQYRFNFEYAVQLTADLSPEEMTLSPHPGLENHPAFTLGHLVSASALLCEDLGKPYILPAGWDELFLRKGPGDPTLPDKVVAHYPGKAELIQELDLQHKMVESLILETHEQQWDANLSWRFSKYFSTLRDLVIFMCITHEAMHLGQLAAWRRAMGKSSALAKL